MAQALFDGHPLEEYLRDSGETSDPIIPGGLAEFSLQLCPMSAYSLPRYSERTERLCYLILGLLEFASSIFSSDHTRKRTQAFAERFKYGVISSTLLTPAFPSTPIPHRHRRSLSPAIPGHLGGSHSRTTSLAESCTSTTTEAFSLTPPAEPETPLWPATLSFSFTIAALSARFYSLSFLSLAGTLYYIHVHRLDLKTKPDVMTPSLEALQNLISAGQVWDAVFNDAFDLLENEERSTLYGSTSPMTPSSSLRIALSSSLLTTQTQCDNVRQLLSAVASPIELSQLTEMYAPPSPLKSVFSVNTDVHRPLSHPGSPQRKVAPTELRRKRSTWNGSYSALALAGSPPAFQMARRRERRRSDLSALIGAASPSRGPNPAAPVSPSPLRPIVDVSEEDSMIAVNSSFTNGHEESFGVAALDLQREQQYRGQHAFDIPHRSTPPSLKHINLLLHHRATTSPASKYTSMPASRHPLSLSTLHQSLHLALASKRFACSHLLALRFEDDDEVYWEDVRSVMALMTSALVDASTRLSEVLDEAEESHLRLDDSATEDPSTINTPCSVHSAPPRLSYKLSQSLGLSAPLSSTSFAPLPSHLSRFAAHISTISSAINDARDQLEQCVTSLKEDISPEHSPHQSPSSTSSVGEHPAIQAYERLRRDLGLALRECERGRDRLVSIVAPLSEEEEVDADADANEPGSEAALGRPKEENDPPTVGGGVTDGDVSMIVVTPDEGADTDDVADHPLLSASMEHFPPPGIEQVYEADTSSVGSFTRERSRLTREERIKLARARREAVTNGGNTSTSGSHFDPDSPSPKMERWGPGGEVVQELKDVIWKVGERRRKMTECQLRTVVSSASSSLPSSPQCAVAPINVLPQSPALS
ncbi:hypothetical protein J3A83DRAFT_4309767 [Scleroderma citrinum]